METKPDIVESLITAAGRRVDPPVEAYRQVFAAASAVLRENTSRRRRRRTLLATAAAAVVVLAVALVTQWPEPGTRGATLATVERSVGGVELSAGDDWRPVAESRGSLGTGGRLRTRADGGAALALAGGESLRLSGDTEILLDAPGRIYVARGRIYVDSGAHPAGSRIEVVTPAGTARDLGTQFELLVAGNALRLRVREGAVSLDRGGQSLTGSAGEQIAIDASGGVTREPIAPDAQAWQWAEALAPTPDMDGKPASILISWVARETGRRLRYATPVVEQRAATVILHGNIRHLPPLEALRAMLATTDLEYVLVGDIMEIRARDALTPEP